jgi:hypothetical protein
VRVFTHLVTISHQKPEHETQRLFVLCRRRKQLMWKRLALSIALKVELAHDFRIGFPVATRAAVEVRSSLRHGQIH